MKNHLYFDYSAGVPLAKNVLKAMNSASVFFGNPSSVHKEGMASHEALFGARKKIAGLFRAKHSEIIFVSGATEANNLVILGIMKKKKNGHIVTSLSEHPSVLGPCRELQKAGSKVTYLEPDSKGFISSDAVLHACRGSTAIVSLSLVNSETGAVQPLRKIISVVKKKKENVLFHSDVSQCVGLLDINPSNFGLDFMTVSVGKIGGPKKLAVLFRKEGRSLDPVFFGGGQEQSLSPGTENIAGVFGALEALREAEKNRKKNWVYLNGLRDFFIRCLKEKMPVIKVLGGETNILPSVVILKTEDISAEALALALDDAGLAVSNGSACSAESKYSRRVETVRFSFASKTTREEIKKAVDIFCLTFIRLRKIYNRK